MIRDRDVSDAEPLFDHDRRKIVTGLRMCIDESESAVRCGEERMER
jgi:hypothetical protein